MIDYSHKVSLETRSYFYKNNKMYTTSELVDMQDSVDSNMVAMPEQVHSTNVKYINTPGIHKKTDGLITDNPNIYLTLKVADCVPIYLFVPKYNIIGLIHSGWKGTVNGIIKNTIRILTSMVNDKNDIKVLLGPSIGMCCYEVGIDVAKYFSNEAKVMINKTKWFVGLKEEIILQLVKFGINSNNIKSINECTFENKQFHSYRRDNSRSGRMIALMSIR